MSGKLDPERLAGYLADRGELYLAKGDKTRAIADFSRAISLGPKASPKDALFKRAQMYIEMRDYGRAIADFTMGVELKEPYNTGFLSSRADAYVAIGDFNHAILDYGEMIRHNNNWGWDGLIQRANAYYAIDEYNRALVDLDEFNSKVISADALLLLGKVYLASREVDRAKAVFDRVLNLEFANAFQRGNAYYWKGEYDRAIVEYDLATRDYASADTLTDRGDAYYGKGDYDRAIADYRAAINLDLGHNRARWGLDRAIAALAIRRP